MNRLLAIALVAATLAAPTVSFAAEENMNTTAISNNEAAPAAGEHKAKHHGKKHKKGGKKHHKKHTAQ